MYKVPAGIYRRLAKLSPTSTGAIPFSTKGLAAPSALLPSGVASYYVIWTEYSATIQTTIHSLVSRETLLALDAHIV